MTLSFGSIFICLLILFVLDIYLELLLRVKTAFYSGNIRCVYFVVMVLTIRSVIPFNFPFTVTIPVQHVLSGIYRKFIKKVSSRFGNSRNLAGILC